MDKDSYNKRWILFSINQGRTEVMRTMCTIVGVRLRCVNRVQLTVA